MGKGIGNPRTKRRWFASLVKESCQTTKKKTEEKKEKTDEEDQINVNNRK